MSGLVESLETRVLYRRPLAAIPSAEEMSDAAAAVQRELADVREIASAHRAALAAAAGAGATLLMENRQALRDALAAGDAAAANAARAKLDSDRDRLRGELAALRAAGRAEILDARGDLRFARQSFAYARQVYHNDLARGVRGPVPPADDDARGPQMGVGVSGPSTGGTTRSTAGGIVARERTSGGDVSGGAGIAGGSVLYGVGVIQNNYGQLDPDLLSNNGASWDAPGLYRYTYLGDPTLNDGTGNG